MYYKSLNELELILFGHRFAFDQLGVITRDQSFNSCFSEWLLQTQDVSCSGGWALAIETVASRMGNNPEVLFAELVERFLSQWRGPNKDNSRAKH